MIGYLTSGSGSAVRQEWRGAAFCVTPMVTTGILASRRRRRQWRTLRQKGVRRAVMAPELISEAAAWGIRPIEIYPLRRAVWAQMAADGETALLRGKTAEADMVRIAEEMARRYRYLQLAVEYDGDGLARKLWRRYGLCAGGGGDAAQTVSFGGAPQKKGEICLGTDCGRWQQVCYEPVPLPEWATQTEMFLSALFQAGALDAEEIRVKSLCDYA